MLSTTPAAFLLPRASPHYPTGCGPPKACMSRLRNSPQAPGEPHTSSGLAHRTAFPALPCLSPLGFTATWYHGSHDTSCLPGLLTGTGGWWTSVNPYRRVPIVLHTLDMYDSSGHVWNLHTDSDLQSMLLASCVLLVLHLLMGDGAGGK